MSESAPGIEFKELQLEDINDELVLAMRGLTKELSETSDLPTLEYLSGIASNPNSHYFVALSEGTPVGKALVNVFPANGTAKAYIDDVITSESYRGMGINSRLLDMVEESAVSSGCTIINLTSSNKSKRDAARRQYEKRGFKKRDTNFYEKRI
jgi:ribosomal protein S18 acetylase RimI-like enzyme